MGYRKGALRRTRKGGRAQCACIILARNLDKTLKRAQDCSRIDWSVLKWNQPSIDFYEKALGAEVMSEWQGMRLTTAGIERLRTFRRQ